MTNKKAKRTRLVGYVRVSKVAGRKGDSFISPKVQREKIDAWARLHDADIEDVLEELDESGAKKNRPKWQEALRRCKEGEADGVIVARLDRFSRSVMDTLTAVRELEKAGARLVSVEESIDGSTPTGQFVLTVLAGLGEMYWKQNQASWEEAISRAVADGVHISPMAPAGYRRENGGRRQRLVPDEKTAEAVREAFRMRAAGTSAGDIARMLESRGALPATGNPQWSRQGVVALLKNRVYLGRAKGWNSIVNETAHEPLVTPEEFAAAQSAPISRKHRHDGSIASQAILVGLLRCAGCGHLMTTTGTTNRDGTRTASYTCRRRFATGDCPAPAASRCAIVDGFVRDAISMGLTTGALRTSFDEVSRWQQAQLAVARAEAELDSLASAELLRTLGPDRLAAMAEPLAAALEEARDGLRSTPRPGTATDLVPDTSLWIDEPVDWGDGSEPYVPWPTERQRRFVRQYVSGLVLRRAGVPGKAAGPVWSRLALTWAGDEAPNGTLGERVDAWRAATPQLVDGRFVLKA